MRALQRAIRAIDALSRLAGALAAWLVVAMVLIGAYNAVARYAGRFVGVRLASNALLELQWYLFSVVFLLGASWALQRGAHVRVDVLYGRYSRRTRAWVDLLGGVLLMLPFALFCLLVAWPSVASSWAVWEQSPDPGGLPRYPLKTLIPVSFGLLTLQGLAEVARSAVRLLGGGEDSEGADEAKGGLPV